MTVQDYFKLFPHKTEVFATTDGFLFNEESDAKNHHKTVNEGEVTKHTKEVVMANNAEAALKAETEKKEVEAAVKADAEKPESKKGK